MVIIILKQSIFLKRFWRIRSFLNYLPIRKSNPDYKQRACAAWHRPFVYTRSLARNEVGVISFSFKKFLVSVLGFL